MKSALVVSSNPKKSASKLSFSNCSKFTVSSVDELRELSEDLSFKSSNKKIQICLEKGTSEKSSVPLLKLLEVDRPIVVVASEESLTSVLVSRFDKTKKLFDSTSDDRNVDELLEDGDFDEVSRSMRDQALEAELVGTSQFPRKDKLFRLAVDSKENGR